MHKWLIVTAVVAAVVLVAYLFATGGSPGREPAAWLTAQPIVHRGQWAQGSVRPENSLAAFTAAAEAGNAIELDVALSKDGKVVVFHDEELKRMTGAEGRLADNTLAELQRLSLAGGSERIPTLSDVFEAVDGRVPIFIEIKNPGSVGKLEEATARQTAAYPGKAAIISFNPFSLARVRDVAPQIPRGQVSSALKDSGLAFYEAFLLRNLLMNWMSGPDFIVYDLTDLPSTTTRIQRWRGRPLIGWTAKSQAERAAAEEFCDAVECDPGALPAD